MCPRRVRRLSSHRTEAPVTYDAALDMWLVSRYADIRAVLLDPDTYRPDNALTAVTPISVTALRRLASAGFTLPATLANNGTASHPALRRLVAGFFTRARVAAVEPIVREWAREYLDLAEHRLDTDGRCDLATTVARELPARVLLHLLGIDGVDVAALKAWSNAALELFWGSPGPERQCEIADAAAQLHVLLQGRVRDARSGRGDDLLHELARCRVAGRPLSVEEAVGVCYFLLIAGQETTTQLISSAFRRLVGSASLWHRLAADPALAAPAVEEVLRLEPPVTTWRRKAARESVLSGVRVPADAQLLLMLAGAGSDPVVFADPERFDTGRSNAHRHLAFGLGGHRCLGASLARFEATVVVSAAASRLPDLVPDTAAGDPQMLDLLSFRAPRQVWVRRSAVEVGA